MTTNVVVWSQAKRSLTVLACLLAWSIPSNGTLLRRIRVEKTHSIASAGVWWLHFYTAYVKACKRNRDNPFNINFTFLHEKLQTQVSDRFLGILATTFRDRVSDNAHKTTQFYLRCHEPGGISVTLGAAPQR